MVSQGGLVFSCETVLDEAFEFGDAVGGSDRGSEVFLYGASGGLTDSLTESVGALVTPPLALFVAAAASRQLPGTIALQVQERGQGQFRPAFHGVELLELILMKAQR